MYDIFFGITDNIIYPINFLILYAKDYIFTCKYNNTKPNWISFSYIFKFHLEIEYSILKSKNKNSMMTELDDYFY